ncbi:glycoside hydrolase family 18 protein [Phlegmacium glaucopus]|nr:glycoside hydrolase family 18 protein [Phlegmacium glaucopus]
MRAPLLPLTLLLSTVAALETIHTRHLLELNTTSRSSSIISAAWYTGWHAADFPLSQVSWSKYTNLIYAFAITTPDVTTLSLTTADETLLPQFVSTAHQNGVKASLSIGGWTGSRWFSTNVRTAQNRTAFVKTVTDMAQKYNLDGLDFDWEYPAVQGIGCNTVNHNDTANFLAFLQQLRKSTIGKGLILSAAAGDAPWVDPSGSPAKDISGFSKVLDYITIMNYDVGSNPAVGAGPSSPLNDDCAPAGARAGSATSAVNAWTAAGMPHNQIVLGVPAYGHSYVIPPTQITSLNVTQLLYPPFDLNLELPGDHWDGDGGLDVCGVMQGPGGIYTYWGLMEQGFLNQNGSVKPGINYRFDECSNTPYLYKPSSRIYVSYDNPRSFAAKGGFIHSMGLKGFTLWEAGGDFHDALLDSICKCPAS